MTTVALAQTERQFERAVVEYAKFVGWKVYHPFDSRRSEPGWPDLTMVRGPRLVFAELKTERGTVSPSQREWLKLLEGVKCGGLRVTYEDAPETYVWRPSMWDEIEEILR